ncbi:MAG TPA: hypothetical protein PLH02_03635 [Bacillota bacterium]|nr:hypothetical protein [Bacillota bacterium]HPF42289.1 hypothetical protein [Bacillota bacterium]HPJ86123.1 hypothetical protein [Bacillota bacterium]HPQ61943.1 hypothetical protein [Bacillota bacterium]HRX91957.1 hypothetical protein [Candidatus Izemoplasmatales bacterium]
MKKEISDTMKKLRDLGLKIAKTAEKGYQQAKSSVESTILEDSLRRRFNLENPYKFQIRRDNSVSDLIEGIMPRNAKRYDEDDMFVFYGDKESNNLTKGDLIKDLSSNADYRIKDLIEVEVPVELDGKTYQVIGTAALCDLL